ncbi:MAG: FtsW/RodA/SpoVE family cell cycle protein [Bacilli bacterium]|nr:FtsW/RodA/SpoVE family cell cycle protein [Bacilli bacterium]
MIHKVHFRIFLSVVLLSIISIVSISSALTYTSASLGNLALKQAMWYVVGWIVVVIIARLKNEYLYQHAWLLYGLGVVLLILLLFFGTPINHSKCWFTIPGIGSIQPSEFMKVFLMIALAIMIHNFHNDYPNPTVKQEFFFLCKSLVVLFIPSILTFLQPDTGAVFIYLIIYFSMIFISGLRFRWFVIGSLLVGIFIGIFLYLYFQKEDVFTSIFGTNFYYRLERVFNWSQSSGLQLENAMSAIGSAGALGHGYNQTPIYFPESSTDFIFAVFASNFGFAGVIGLILIIFFFDIQIFLLTRKKILDTNKYIIAGILGMLVFQQIQNIGMTLGLLPIMGITLPFVSYGGSSLLSYMLLIGILYNISNQKKQNYQYR